MVAVSLAMRLLLLAGPVETSSCGTANLSIASGQGVDAGVQESVTENGTVLCLKGLTSISFSFVGTVNGRKTQFYSPPLAPVCPDNHDDCVLVASDADGMRWGLRLKGGVLSACVAGGPLPSKVCAVVPPVGDTPTETKGLGVGMTGPVLMAGGRLEMPPGVMPGLVVVRCTLTKDGLATGCVVVNHVHDAKEWTVLEHLAHQRYFPVTFRGRPVQVSYVFNFRFE
jgi:Gram-negative bacterial TonB protein C-terminal